MGFAISPNSLSSLLGDNPLNRASLLGGKHLNKKWGQQKKHRVARLTGFSASRSWEFRRGRAPGRVRHGDGRGTGLLGRPPSAEATAESGGIRRDGFCFADAKPEPVEEFGNLEV